MTFPWRIAWRYLFAKKRISAINIVSLISAMGVGVVAAAMICVLSVMNGFGSLIENFFSAFDPEIKIVSANKKSFDYTAESFREIQQMPSVQVFCPVIEELALVSYEEKQFPVYVKGVSSNFQALTLIDSIMYDGRFDLFRSDAVAGIEQTRYEHCVVGVGVNAQLGISRFAPAGLKFYAPKRKGQVSVVRPDKSFTQTNAIVSGSFAVNQQEYDDQYILVTFQHAQELFEMEEAQATAVEIKLTPTANTRKTKEQLRKMLGTDFLVLDRYEQQRDFFRILKIEKLLTLLLLVFILLIASFNIIGSLSMLMIDKQQDTRILQQLGATQKQSQHIFLFEGWLISLIGAIIGIIIGVVICLIQQHFGLLKLGDGASYVVNAYPVKVLLSDILLTLFFVVVIGFIAAYIPASKIKFQ